MIGTPAGQSEGTLAARPAGAPPPLGRLAWRVFAPLDAVINVAINAEPRQDGGVALGINGGFSQ